MGLSSNRAARNALGNAGLGKKTAAVVVLVPEEVVVMVAPAPFLFKDVVMNQLMQLPNAFGHITMGF